MCRAKYRYPLQLTGTNSPRYFRGLFLQALFMIPRAPITIGTMATSLDLRQLHDKTKISPAWLVDLHNADEVAFSSHSKDGLQRIADAFAIAQKRLSLTTELHERGYATAWLHVCNKLERSIWTRINTRTHTKMADQQGYFNTKASCDVSTQRGRDSVTQHCYNVCHSHLVRMGANLLSKQLLVIPLSKGTRGTDNP